MKDLIGNIFDESICLEDNRAVDILQEQARLIGKKSNGIIKGSFARIEYTQTQTGAQKAVSSVADVLSYLQISETEEDDEELKSKADINEWYKYVPYKFEIYNDTYKFRIFILNSREVFPIELLLDEGIGKEIKMKNPILIASNERLEEVVSSIFNSIKLKQIIKKMMDYKSKTIMENVIELLSNGSEMSISEISESLNISKSATTITVKKLNDSGKVAEISKGRNRKWKLSSQS